MPTLYVTEQHALLRKTGDRLIVEKDGTVLLEVPCLKLDAVAARGVEDGFERSKSGGYGKRPCNCLRGKELELLLSELP